MRSAVHTNQISMRSKLTILQHLLSPEGRLDVPFPALLQERIRVPPMRRRGRHYQSHKEDIESVPS